MGLFCLVWNPAIRNPNWGFLLCPAAEGQGIAFEAASAVKAYAKGQLKLPSLVSYIDAGNQRSIALATRLGAYRDFAAETHINHEAQCWRHWDISGGPQ